MNESASPQEAAPHYQTFLLTCWQERDEVVGTAVWRFRLETLRSGQRRISTTLEKVMSIIKTELHHKTTPD